MSGKYVSQVWLPKALEVEEFAKALLAEFPTGKVTHIPLVPEAQPAQEGCNYLEVIIPLERKDEWDPFFAAYAKKHDYEVKQRPADGFGWNHSG